MLSLLFKAKKPKLAKKMNIFHRYRVFQKAATAVLFLFLGIMAYVIGVSYSRSSGSTGLDMSKIQQLRLVESP